MQMAGDADASGDGGVGDSSAEDGDPSPLLTIGIAIPVPEPYAGELQRCRKEFGDPLADAIPAHVTLLPPTVISGKALAEVEAHLCAAAQKVNAFSLRLGPAGTFRPVSPVVFVQVAAGAEDCADLEAAVRSGPLNRELAFPYHPHVTVAHHVAEENLDRALTDLATYSAEFPVNSFCLYEHGADGVWRPDRCFVLGSSEVRRNVQSV